MSPGDEAKGRRRVPFAQSLAAFGDRVAVVTDTRESLTYASLAERADAFAVGLVGRRRLVMIEAANELEPLTAYLGALRQNHPVLLASSSPAQNETLVETFRPDVVVAKSNGVWTTRIGERSDHQLHPDLAVLLVTSGSTGAGKLVRLSHEAIASNAAAIVQYLKIEPDDRAVANLPMSYSYGHSIISSHLTCGARVLLTNMSVIDERFWDFFGENGATSLAGAPYTYELLERVGFRDMQTPSLRSLTQAGGRLAPSLAAKYGEWASARGVRFYVMYGQTEAAPRMAYLAPDQVVANPDAIGQPIPGGAFRIAGPDDETITAPGVEGELVYSGPNVMLGYAEAPADLAKGREIAELRTGDLAARDEGGLYRITGRVSRICKPFGLRISLDRVEQILADERFRAIAAGDDTLIAVAVSIQEETIDGAGAVRQLLADRLGLPQAVIDVALVEALPMLPNGKPDYRSVMAGARVRAQQARDRRETGVFAAFARTFPNVEIDRSDSFLSLNGGSLSYVSLSLQLEEILSELPRYWEAKSIGEIESLAAVQTAPAKTWSAPIAIDSGILVRGFAILTVVANHAELLFIAGGANVLLTLAGLNIGKNSYTKLINGKGFSILPPFLSGVILPYYVIMTSYLIYVKKVDIASLFLVGNFFGRVDHLNSYWFLEFLLQSMLIICLAFEIPFVRKSAKADPWLFGLVTVIAATAVRIAVYGFFHRYHHHVEDRTPDTLFYLVALGWTAAFSDTASRKIVVTLLAVGLGLFDWFGLLGVWFRDEPPKNITHAVFLAASVCAILWAERIKAPRIVHRAAGLVAASSFCIYITLPITLHVFSPRGPHYVAAWGFLVSVLVGVLIWLGIRQVQSWLVSRSGRDRFEKPSFEAEASI